MQVYEENKDAVYTNGSYTVMRCNLVIDDSGEIVGIGHPEGCTHEEHEKIRTLAKRVFDFMEKEG